TRHGEATRELGPELHLPAAARSVAADRPRFFYRVRFAKRGDLRWLSHLDLMRALQRGFKRAGVQASYSYGFHPQPLFSFGPAPAVGIESEAELFDFETATSYDPSEVRSRLERALPAGLHILEVNPIAPGGPSLAARLDLAEYRAWLNESRRALVPDEF